MYILIINIKWNDNCTFRYGWGNLEGTDIASRELIMAKQNCWEYMKCGKQPGGKRALDESICPAAIEHRLDGIHGGKKAGRACWVSAGTFCRGEMHGIYAKKINDCRECDFYQLVKLEEFPNNKLSSTLIRMLEESEE
jgi:hypothetical protein